jgi:hypothetical protein
MAATAAALVTGGVLLPATSAMAAPMPAGDTAATTAADAMPTGQLCADQWGMMTWCS